MSLEKGMGKMARSGRWMQGAATGMAVFAMTFLVSFVSGSIFLAPKASNAETDGPSVSVNVSTTLAISTDATDGVLSIPLTPTSAGTEAIGVLNVDISTNNLTGYTLSVSSSTNTTDLVHTADTTATIPTTTATTTAPAALTTNQWGYSNWTDTQIANSTAPSTYYRVPGTTSDTIRTTAEPLAHSVSRLSFAARADTTIPAGTYAHTLSFTATSNYVPAIPACPVLAGKTYLQDIETPTSRPYGEDRERVVLKDRRDGQDYYVQNIANEDGSCLAWMETNLRYGGDGNYDATWGYADDRYATTASNTTDNINDDVRPLTMTSSGYFGGSQYTSNFTVAGVADAGGSTDYTNTSPGTYGQPSTYGFFGYLYNWCSAMGGQPNACNDTSTSGFDTTQSICPAGWRLPTGEYRGEFWDLNKAVNDGRIVWNDGLIDNWLAVYSGSYGNDLSGQGDYIRYWSSTVYSATNAYLLESPDFGVVSFDSEYSKVLGLGVRCVKDNTPPLQDEMAMQDATSSMCAKTPIGATVNLRDSRDDKYYRVRKMADGRCWMVDNLAYDLVNDSAPAYSPSVALVSGATASVNSQAQYVQNTTAYDIPNNGSPTPSYLYNWCAAMGDTSANCAATVGYGAGQPAAPQTGICPAPFRLPIGGAEATTQGNGTNQATAAATTTNEFAKLDIWLGGIGANRYSANTYTNFTTDDTANPQLFWLGVLGGYYNSSGLVYQGNYGYWWSSMANSSTLAYRLNLSSGSSNVSPSLTNDKSIGFAVRCVL